jgi:hypothetical protein
MGQADVVTSIAFLSDDVLQKALSQLEEDRPAYSIDQWFSQMGIEEDCVAEALREEAVRASGELSMLVDDGRIRVFREVLAPKDWDHAAETRPHRFWSHCANHAHAHWGEGEGVRWLLSGSVAIDDVDEPTTLALNANPLLCDEREIRLKADAHAKIDQIEMRPDSHWNPVF